MALSEREQKLLEQMEQALYAEDPRFATRIRSQDGGRSRRRLVIGLVAVLVGLGLVFLGVLDKLVWPGAVGFALMVAGAVWAFASARPVGPTGVVRGDGSVHPVGGSSAGKSPKAARARGQGFMQRLEERWERRERDQ